MVTGCQKLVNDPGGEKPIFESDSGLVHWGGDYEDKGLAVVQTADGGYAVVGSEYSLENQLDLILVKFDSKLTPTDSLSFGGVNSAYNNEARDIQQTDDGGYVLVGSTLDNEYDVWVVKYTPGLDVAWQDTIKGTTAETGDFSDYGNSIQQTNDGGYIVCGTSFDGDDSDIMLWKVTYDITQSDSGAHELIWGENLHNGTCAGADSNADGILDDPQPRTASLCADPAGDASGTAGTWAPEDAAGTDNGTPDRGFHAQQTNDGGYIIVGSSYSSTTAYDIRLIKLNSDYSIAFNNTYEVGSGFNDEEGIYVQQTGDNGFVVVGNYGGSGEGNVFILKTDYLGTDATKTIQTYGSGTFPDAVAAVRQTMDGGFIMVGNKYSQASTMDDVWVIKFTHDLSPEWNYTYGKDLGDFGTSISQTSDGGYIITGYSYSYPDARDKQSQIILLKLTGDGLLEDPTNESTTNN